MQRTARGGWGQGCVHVSAGSLRCLLPSLASQGHSPGGQSSLWQLQHAVKAGCPKPPDLLPVQRQTAVLSEDLRWPLQPLGLAHLPGDFSLLPQLPASCVWIRVPLGGLQPTLQIFFLFGSVKILDQNSNVHFTPQIVTMAGAEQLIRRQELSLCLPCGCRVPRMEGEGFSPLVFLRSQPASLTQVAQVH